MTAAAQSARPTAARHRPAPRAQHRSVTAVAVGQLDGRPIIVSGSDDYTVRVWDQAGPRTNETHDL
ncbi:hypothetical protein Pa4123_38970 [Phytohabitans aurantiacus]|uniref:Uncharacterized protein n=1 Tax=Phytohabitans aurantiacus TaxID=3016789 RepID=A0ABQ5QXH0_9ACTN|nr:hypothetical protein Pa4123_38970 [Phytohabitans aurantiacus]